MITLNRTGDAFDRKMLSVDQMSDDKQSRFIFTLITSDLSALFENSSNRRVTLSIVSMNDDQEGGDNALLIPVVLSGVVVTGDKTKSYYAQSNNGSGTFGPSLTLDCYVTSDGDTQLITHPHLLVVFGVETMADTDPDLSSNNANTAGVTDSDRRIDENENANGGMDVEAGTSEAEKAQIAEDEGKVDSAE